MLIWAVPYIGYHYIGRGLRRGRVREMGGAGERERRGEERGRRERGRGVLVGKSEGREVEGINGTIWHVQDRAANATGWSSLDEAAG